MKMDELKRITNNGESEMLEFKRSTGQLDGAMRTLCAFLNGKGGTVLIGVRDDGNIIGQDVGPSTLEDIAEKKRLFEPPASITTDRVRIGDGYREVIALTVQSPDDTRPFAYDGKPYWRRENTTSRMPQQEYESLLLQRVHASKRWENTNALDYDLANIDKEEILRTIREGKERQRLSETIEENPEEFLKRMQIMTGNGRFLNAAVVLFGTEFMPDYPQCELRLARFKGKDKSEFLDSNQLRGHVFFLLQEAMIFLTRHLPVASKIVNEKLERIDEPLFPPQALREALVNAFCHRDYSIFGGCVNVAVFDDKLEIWSDGGIPFGQTVDDLKRDHKSLLRNPIIADVLYRRGLVEKWGRGTQKIIELCIAAGHPEPEFITNGQAVGVVFNQATHVARKKIEVDLTHRQLKILELLGTVDVLHFKDIKGEFDQDITDKMIKHDLVILKQHDLIDTKGFGRGAVWYLKDTSERRIRNKDK